MTAISLQNVCKYYQKVKIIDDVSFMLEEGKLLVLLGPSGCGKSTTLRVIAGLEQITSGNIFIDGVNVTKLPPSERKLAMVFQSYALFPHLTIRDNILFGLKVRKVPKEEQEKRLKRAVEILQLEGLLLRKPAMLSGGQQQRVALGRALVAEAAVCLMDEPLSNLDAELRVTMRKEIRAIQKALGITMIYVTHDQTEAMSMADQIILMEQGRIVQNTTPGVLYEKPETLFSAGFIGNPPMNLLRLSRENGSVTINGAPNIRLDAIPSKAEIMGIRPEHVYVADSGWHGVIEAIEYQGSVSFINCIVGSEKVTFMQGGAVNYGVGDTVLLNIKKEHLNFFHVEGNRIC